MLKKWRSSSKENKDKAKEHDASAMDCVAGQNIPPKTFNSYLELQPFMELVTELKERSGPAMDALRSCCKDNQEKEEKISMQAKEIQALTDLAAEKELTINQLQGLLRQKQVEMETAQLHAEEMERNLSKELSDVKGQRNQEMLERCQLDEERKALNAQISHLSKDLHACEEQVKSLHEELKASTREFEDLQKKTVYLLSRVQNLQEEAKDYAMKYKEADGKYQLQLSISGTLYNKKSELQERSAQLTLDLAQANEAVQAVASERDTLRTVVHEHEAEKDRLQIQLQEWDRRMSDLQQVHDAQVNELQERSAQLTLNLAQANEAVQAVASERDTLRTVLQEHEAEKERLQVQLQDRDRQMSDLKQVHADQVRMLNVQLSHLSEDLHAREKQVKSLLQQLKETDGLQKKTAFLLSRVQNLQEEVIDNQLKYKDADGKYQLQLSISGTLYNDKSELQERCTKLTLDLAQANEAALAVASERDMLRTEEERLKVQLQVWERRISDLKQVHDVEVSELEERSAQLTLDIAQANEAVQAVASERDSLRTMIQEHVAKEERFQIQLRERDKIMSELKQGHSAEIGAMQGTMMQLIGSLESRNEEFSAVVAYNRQCQRLWDVAENDAVDTAGQCARQPVRYNLRPRHRTQESATASGVFSIDASGASTEAILSASHPPMSRPGVPQLPGENLPKVKTEVLVPYLVQISPQWDLFAHALGVGDVAENLRQLQLDPTSKCLQCLVAWIERGPEVDCSWEKLLVVLNRLQLHGVAQEILGELWRRAFPNTP